MSIVAPGPAPGGPAPVGLLEYLDLSTDQDVAVRRRTAFRSALLAEALGYHRVWIPEHHGVGSPSTNPVPLVAVLGSHTARIRVGTAVSLARIRDPYLTAEDFVTAGAFCGDRLDVGLGRGAVAGPGTEVWDHLRKDDAATERAMSTVVSVLDSGCAWIDPLRRPYQRWMHGAGGRSAASAGRLGFDYCHGLFLNPDEDTCRHALAAHRAAYPGGRRAVALALVVGDDPVRTRADAARHRGVRVARAGTAAECAGTALRLRDRVGAQEVVLAELSRDPDDHLAALEQLYPQLTAAAGPTADPRTADLEEIAR